MKDTYSGRTQGDRLGRVLKATIFGAAMLVIGLSVLAFSAIGQLDDHVRQWLWTDRVSDANAELLQRMEVYAQTRSSSAAIDVSRQFSTLGQVIARNNGDAGLAAELSPNVKEAYQAFVSSVRKKSRSERAHVVLHKAAKELEELFDYEIALAYAAADNSARRAILVEAKQKNELTSLRSLMEAMTAAQSIERQVRALLHAGLVNQVASPRIQFDGLPPVCDADFGARFRHLCVPSSARLRRAVEVLEDSEPGSRRFVAARRVLQATGGFLRVLGVQFEQRTANLERGVDAVTAERISALNLGQWIDTLVGMQSTLSEINAAINVIPTLGDQELAILDTRIRERLDSLVYLGLQVFDAGAANQARIQQADAAIAQLEQSWATKIAARQAERASQAEMRAALARKQVVTTGAVQQIRAAAEAWIAVFTQTTVVVLFAFGAFMCGGALMAYFRLARPIARATESVLRLADGDTSQRIDRRDGGKALCHLFDALGTLQQSSIARLEAEERAAEAAHKLSNAHAQLTFIADKSPVAVYTFRLMPDGEMDLPYRSAMYHDLFGVDAPEDTPEGRAELLSTIFEKRVLAEDMQAMSDSIEVSRTEMAPWRLRFRVDHPTRGRRWLRGLAIPHKKQDGTIDWVGTISDVTEDVNHEQELEAARSKAEAASHAKSNFLANMSHEIRTPMNGIIGMSELLQETELNEEQSLCARTIKDSANSLLTIINDVLDFSKVEAGRLDVTMAPLDLYDLVFDVCRLLTPKAREKGFEVCVDFNPNIETRRIGDYGRLRQILLNVIGNAVKFTEKGYVLVSVDANERGDVEIVVHDTGLGIPQEGLDAIFKAFEQIDNERTRQHDGTGLGLAITQKLLQLMGGGISVSSSLGEGSEFTLRISLSVDAEAKTVDPRPDIREKAVLFVEGGEVTREILVNQIIALGGIPVPASTQEEALERLNEPALQPVDLLIIDSHATEVSGDLLVQALRNTQAPISVPIVLHAPFDYAVSRQDLIDRGYSDAFARPAGYRELTNTILPLLEHGSANQAAPSATRAESSGNNETEAVPIIEVMAAEDNRTNQLVLKKMLAGLSVNLQIFQDGVEILDAYCEQGTDLILMDMSMPRMDGLEATRAIRAHEAQEGWDPCPIFALTANALSQHRDACMKAGMDGFLTKPIRKQALADLLAEHRRTGDEDEGGIKNAG